MTGNPAIRAYHERLFDAHLEVFDFENALTRAEVAYLEACVESAQLLPPPEAEVWGGYFAYAHRVDLDHVDSSRLAFGTFTEPGAAWGLARAVLEERDIHPSTARPGAEDALFFGLEWHFASRALGVHFRLPEIDTLRKRFPDHFVEAPPARRVEGIFTTWFRPGRPVEHQVAFFPVDDVLPPALAAGTRARTVITSDRRAAFSMYDVASQAVWYERLNPTGREVVDDYFELGESLDAVVWEDPDHFTLYFP